MAHQFFFNPYILDNLPAPSAGFDVVQDLSDPRLRMYITSRGVKTFFVRKRVGGRDKRIIIGNYPDIDIESARNAIPGILENAMRRPQMHRGVTPFKKIIDMYIARRVRRNAASMFKLTRSVDRHLKPLFNRNVGDITPADISDLIGQIKGPAIAGRMQELLQSIFNFAMENGYVRTNPVADLPRVKQQRRVRPLTRAGFQKLIAAIKQEESPNLRAAFLMLIYGFAPKSKIFSMQWRDLDFNHYMWREMPLSDAAVVLLQDVPQNGKWVFPGRSRGHLIDPRLAWNRVAARASIPDLTMDDVHKFLMRSLVWTPVKEDLRHNMNTLLAETIGLNI